jgi:hypothetical protein
VKGWAERWGCLCRHGLMFSTDSVRCEDIEDKGNKMNVNGTEHERKLERKKNHEFLSYAVSKLS